MEGCGEVRGKEMTIFIRIIFFSSEKKNSENVVTYTHTHTTIWLDDFFFLEQQRINVCVCECLSAIFCHQLFIILPFFFHFVSFQIQFVCRLFGCLYLLPFITIIISFKSTFLLLLLLVQEVFFFFSFSSFPFFLVSFFFEKM